MPVTIISEALGQKADKQLIATTWKMLYGIVIYVVWCNLRHYILMYVFQWKAHYVTMG